MPTLEFRVFISHCYHKGSPGLTRNEMFCFNKLIWINFSTKLSLHVFQKCYSGLIYYSIHSRVRLRVLVMSIQTGHNVTMHIHVWVCVPECAMNVTFDPGLTIKLVMIMLNALGQTGQQKAYGPQTERLA